MRLDIDGSAPFIDRAGMEAEYAAIRSNFPLPLPAGVVPPREVPAPAEPPEGALYQAGCGLLFAAAWWLSAITRAVIDADNRADRSICPGNGK